MTAADHVRIIAEAMGLRVFGAGEDDLRVRMPLETSSSWWLHADRPDDVLVFAAHAVAWAAGEGYRLASGERSYDRDGCHMYHRHGHDIRPYACHDYDPTDPHDTARATLAAVAEVVGMMNQGGE